MKNDMPVSVIKMEGRDKGGFYIIKLKAKGFHQRNLRVLVTVNIAAQPYKVLLENYDSAKKDAQDLATNLGKMFA